MKYIHVSTGPGHVPRRSPVGRVRSPEQKGSTYNVGRNAAKRDAMPNRKTRSGRKWIKALHRANPTIRKFMRDRGKHETRTTLDGPRVDREFRTAGAVPVGGDAMSGHMPVCSDFETEGEFRAALRDYFAGQALAGMALRHDGDYSENDHERGLPTRHAERYAAAAYRIADATLAERDKP